MELQDSGDSEGDVITIVSQSCGDLTIGDYEPVTSNPFNAFKHQGTCSDSQGLTSDSDQSELDNESGDAEVSSSKNSTTADAAWADFWEKNGEEIATKTWLEKYKEYINPDFDLTSWTSAATAQEHSQSKPEETDTQGKAETLSEAELSTLWAHEWEQHYSNIYYLEYNKFVEESKSAADLEMPEDIVRNKALKKYWVMRYHLFSKYDDGIKLDEESWFSVTPETIAKHIAARCRRVDGVIVDAFCGCGGNTIHFAKKFSKVIAIDIDPKKIEYAKHNAAIYGVENNIEFILGNYLHLAPYLKADVVFLSPPWGGPEYANVPMFDLKKMKPLNGFDVFEATKQITSNIAYYVPRNTNTYQLMQLAGNNNFVEIERNMFKSKVKAVTAYYGNLIKSKSRK